MPAIFVLLLYTLLVPYLCFSFIKDLNKRRRMQLYMLAAGLILFAGLRSESTFSDTDSYYLHFLNVSDNGNFWEVPKERFEPGYLIFEKFIHKYISHNPAWLIFIVSCFSIGTVFYLLKKEAKNLWLCSYLFIALYLYISGFVCPVRQSLAASLCIWSFFATQNRRIILSTLLILIATFIHSSAICFFVLLPISYLPLNRKNIIWVIVSSVLAFGALGSIIEMLGRGTSTYLEDENMQLGNILDLIKAISILLFAYFLKVKNSSREVIWLAIISSVAAFLSLKITVLNRVTSYFEVFLIILLVNLAYSLSRHNRSIVYIGLIMIGFIHLLLIYVYRPEWNRIDSYNTILNSLL